jgi:hypothetical protein
MIPLSLVAKAIELIRHRDTRADSFERSVALPDNAQVGPVLLNFTQIVERYSHPAYAPVCQARNDIVRHIASLSLSYARQLLMILYIGRGDYTPECFFSTNRMIHERDARIIAQMIADKRPAARYIESGMNAIWSHCCAGDRMNTNNH